MIFRNYLFLIVVHIALVTSLKEQNQERINKRLAKTTKLEKISTPSQILRQRAKKQRLLDQLLTDQVKEPIKEISTLIDFVQDAIIETTVLSKPPTFESPRALAETQFADHVQDVDKHHGKNYKTVESLFSPKKLLKEKINKILKEFSDEIGKDLNNSPTKPFDANITIILPPDTEDKLATIDNPKAIEDFVRETKYEKPSYENTLKKDEEQKAEIENYNKEKINKNDDYSHPIDDQGLDPDRLGLSEVEDRKSDNKEFGPLEKESQTDVNENPLDGKESAKEEPEVKAVENKEDHKEIEQNMKEEKLENDTNDYEETQRSRNENSKDSSLNDDGSLTEETINEKPNEEIIILNPPISEANLSPVIIPEIIETLEKKEDEQLTIIEDKIISKASNGQNEPLNEDQIPNKQEDQQMNKEEIDPNDEKKFEGKKKNEEKEVKDQITGNFKEGEEKLSADGMSLEEKPRTTEELEKDEGAKLDKEKTNFDDEAIKEENANEKKNSSLDVEVKEKLTEEIAMEDEMFTDKDKKSFEEESKTPLNQENNTEKEISFEVEEIPNQQKELQKEETQKEEIDLNNQDTESFDEKEEKNEFIEKEKETLEDKSVYVNPVTKESTEIKDQPTDRHENADSEKDDETKSKETETYIVESNKSGELKIEIKNVDTNKTKISLVLNPIDMTFESEPREEDKGQDIDNINYENNQPNPEKEFQTKEDEILEAIPVEAFLRMREPNKQKSKENEKSENDNNDGKREKNNPNNGMDFKSKTKLETTSKVNNNITATADPKLIGNSSIAHQSVISSERIVTQNKSSKKVIPGSSSTKSGRPSSSKGIVIDDTEETTNNYKEEIVINIMHPPAQQVNSFGHWPLPMHWNKTRNSNYSSPWTGGDFHRHQGLSHSVLDEKLSKAINETKALAEKYMELQTNIEKKEEERRARRIYRRKEQKTADQKIMQLFDGSNKGPLQGPSKERDLSALASVLSMVHDKSTVVINIFPSV